MISSLINFMRTLLIYSCVLNYLLGMLIIIIFVLHKVMFCSDILCHFMSLN